MKISTTNTTTRKDVSMFAKSLAFAAAICISTGVAAKPVKSPSTASLAARSASPRSAALENIIGRVQLDVLIDKIVSSDSVKLAGRRGVEYAGVASTKSRNRS